MTEHPKHGSPGTANYIDARTTWFDHAVEGAKKLGLTQIVVIAAGFDSRAYRLHAAGLQVCDCSQMYCSHSSTTYPNQQLNFCLLIFILHRMCNSQIEPPGISRNNGTALVVQFYEIDLPHASIIKQSLVQNVLPDAVKVGTAIALLFCIKQIFLCFHIHEAYACMPGLTVSRCAHIIRVKLVVWLYLLLF